MTKKEIIQQIEGLIPKTNYLNIPKNRQPNFDRACFGRFRVEDLCRTSDIDGKEIIKCSLHFYNFRTGARVSIDWFPYGQLKKLLVILKGT